MLISIALMATPFGIAMTFAPGPSKRLTEYFSYFKLISLGYGNWLPAITVILSFVVIILLLVDLRNANLGKMIRVCLIICIFCSVLSWLIFDSFTFVGACVAFFHISALVMNIKTLA
jgi:hypothetical protein